MDECNPCFADIGVFIPQMKEGMEDNVYGNKPAPSKVPPTILYNRWLLIIRSC